MESEAEIARMAMRRREMSSAAAEKSGESILDLAIVDDRLGLGGRYLFKFARRRTDRNMPWHRLKVGSPVIVTDFFPDDPERFNDKNSANGVVSGLTRDTIEVAVDYWLDGRFFRVDLTADEVTRQRQLAAIMTVKEARGRLGHLRNITMGDKEPKFRDDIQTSDIRFRTELNHSQQEAVRHALSASDLAIVHGPPGTGKTTTIVELIVQAVERGERVLACAPSNTAVDNMLERLIDHGQNVVRIGHPARVAELLQDHTLDGLVEKSDAMPVIRSMVREAEELFRKADRYTRARPGRGVKAELRREAKRLKNDARMLERQTVQNILDSAKIICATSTFNEDMLGDRWFDLAVIDEACQSTEPGSWIPLMRCDRVVLAGDHQQLPPTVLSEKAAEEGFRLSLMERVINLYGDQVTRLLDVQYRMHHQIMTFSSEQFYDGQLIGHDSVREHLLCDLPDVEQIELTQSPIQFIDSAGANWDEELEPDGLSKRNPKEAELILKKADALVAAGIDPKDIAIIAPYAAQARMIRRQCKHRHLEVDTVDGFQGREKEAVLITCVRSNPTGEIGFLSDARRMNVALTRARRKLIVIGDSATLGSNEFFAKLLSYFESVGAYGSVWTE